MTYRRPPARHKRGPGKSRGSRSAWRTQMRSRRPSRCARGPSRALEKIQRRPLRPSPTPTSLCNLQPAARLPTPRTTPSQSFPQKRRHPPSAPPVRSTLTSRLSFHETPPLSARRAHPTFVEVFSGGGRSSADFQSAVSPTCSRQAPELAPGSSGLPEACRLKICVTPSPRRSPRRRSGSFNFELWRLNFSFAVWTTTCRA